MARVTPLIFTAHAHTMGRLCDVLAALQAFEAEQPPGAAGTIFYWFDIACVDQHASQALPQEWWGTTYRAGSCHAHETIVVRHLLSIAAQCGVGGGYHIWYFYYI